MNAATPGERLDRLARRLLVEVFGDMGRHARPTVGLGSLPDNITVEIEAIVAFRN